MNRNRDFICFSYKYTDYLIEKNLLTESLYFEQNNSKTISREIDISGKETSVINLDYLISQSFFDTGVSRESMIIKIADRVIETTAQAFVKNVQLSEFRMFGSLMDSYFQKKGLIAIRYLETGRVQYLLDINKFINVFEESK